MREFVLKHVAPVKNKKKGESQVFPSLACLCVCVRLYVCMCSHVWILAAIREAVKTHRGALEVFYHAAVIVACLLVVTLSAVFLQGNIQ